MIHIIVSDHLLIPVGNLLEEGVDGLVAHHCVEATLDRQGWCGHSTEDMLTLQGRHCLLVFQDVVRRHLVTQVERIGFPLLEVSALRGR